MADIATIISCGVAIIGVMQVVGFVIEVRPVVNEFQRLIDTVSIPYRDTVFIPKEIVKSDTVVVYRNVFKRDTVFVCDKGMKSNALSSKVSEGEKERINQKETDFRKKMQGVFQRKK